MTCISSADSKSNDTVTDIQETSDMLDGQDCEERQATEDTTVTPDSQDRQEIPTPDETDSQDRQEIPPTEETYSQERC